jgi:hypothetical protein
MTGRGVEWVALPDGRRWPGRVRNGLPEFKFGQAPAGLSTRRQLRKRGLSRGGQEPFARLVWKRDQRFAWPPSVDSVLRASEAQVPAPVPIPVSKKSCEKVIDPWFA